MAPGGLLSGLYRQGYSAPSPNHAPPPPILVTYTSVERYIPGHKQPTPSAFWGFSRLKLLLRSAVLCAARAAVKTSMLPPRMCTEGNTTAAGLGAGNGTWAHGTAQPVAQVSPLEMSVAIWEKSPYERSLPLLQDGNRRTKSTVLNPSSRSVVAGYLPGCPFTLSLPIAHASHLPLLSYTLSSP